MFKFTKALLIIIILSSIGSIHADAASAVLINDLIENEKELDGTEITIQGEAIGEEMDRGDYSWININDGSNAIGLWLSNAEAEKVQYYGDYKYVGDIVEITGTFYRACKEHGGEPDLHVTSLRIVKEGYPVTEEVEYFKIISIISLMILTLFVVFVYLKQLKKIQTLKE